jgi:hypothetical protein
MPPYTIEHYGNRFFALYKGDDLLAVTVYKKGATRLKEELTKRDTEIAKRSLAPMKSTHEPQAS